MSTVKMITPPMGTILVHHTNKQGMQRGASRLDEATQANWLLNPEGDDMKTLKIESRTAGRKSIVLKYDTETCLVDKPGVNMDWIKEC